VDARGIEIAQSNVNQCVARGLSVVQGDADTDLLNYPDNAFDFAILSQTIQATRRPLDVLEQLLRIGKRTIVSFPNFGHWRIRSQIMFRGRMPVTQNLSYAWYDTPNIHFCTIDDFVALCKELDAKIERSVALNAQGQRLGLKIPLFMQNMLGEQAIFLLSR
jgi:methionine biosynthesis protein MetW